jgi:hypothetical protein
MKTSEDFYDYLMIKISDNIAKLEYQEQFDRELSIKANTEIARLKLEAAQIAQEIYRKVEKEKFYKELQIYKAERD